MLYYVVKSNIIRVHGHTEMATSVITSAKDAGSTLARAKEIVLLEPNTGGRGNYHTTWLENVRSRSADLDKYTALYLSFLFTGERYKAPMPNRAAIVLEYTTPEIAANGQQAAVAAIPPSDEIVDRLYLDALSRREKTMANVNSCGTLGWQFLEESISHASQVSVGAVPAVVAANLMAPKDAFVLFKAIEASHAAGGAGGIKLSSQEVDRVDEAFAAFKQNDLEPGDFHKLYVKWLDKRKAVGLPDFDETTKVTKFYAKLDTRRYAELLRERENTERALILAGLPVADLTLTQALQHVNGYVPPGGIGVARAKSVSSVFTVKDSSVDPTELENACRVLAATVPGASTESVLLALKNVAKNGKGSGGGKKPAVGSECEPLMVGGRAWTRKCSEPGCKMIHPFYLHEAITGKQVCAATKAKMDAYAARMAKKKEASSVLVTKEEAESDDEADHYFVHVAKVGDERLDDDDDDECYDPELFSCLVTTEGILSGCSELFTEDWRRIGWCLLALGFLIVVSKVIDYTNVLDEHRSLDEHQAFPIKLHHSPFDADFLLFDNQAGISMVKDLSILVNVLPLRRQRVINGITGDNGGALVAESDGEIPGLTGLRFPFVKGASANILAEVDALEAGWEVQRASNGNYRVTTPTSSLEFSLLPGWRAHPACRIANIKATTLTTTVTANLTKYSTAEQIYARKARTLQENLGLPCSQYLSRGLSGISNSGITPQDIKRADDIGGPALAKIRGGMHHRPTPAARIEGELTRTVKESLTAEIDIFFVHGLAFLICVLLPLNHVMGTYLKHRTVGEIGAALLAFVAAASARMFDITFFRCDGEKAVATYAPELNRMNIRVESDPGVKCPHVERTNQTIGEYVRGQMNGGFAARMGKALIVMCVLFKISRLNLLPTKASADGFGSFVKWEGIAVDAKRDLSWKFGDYVEATKPAKSGSKYASRTSGCIAGIPTMSRSGSALLFQLSTRTMVTRTAFQIRPMPDWVFKELEEIAEEDNLPSGDEYIGDGTWNFEFEDDAEVNVDAIPKAPEEGNVPGLPAAVVAAAARNPNDDANGGTNGEIQVAEAVEQPREPRQELPIVQEIAEQPQQLQLPAPARRGRGGAGDSLRSVRGGSALLNRIIDSEDRASVRKELMQRRHWHDKEFCFKISVRAALRERGESAKAAIMSELQQMISKGVWHGVHLQDLTSSQRKTILRTVTFLKDKYTAQNIFEKFKARMCVDGSRQDRAMYEDVSSPTATTAAVLSCAAIAAAEGRQVMTIDVSGAFLHADMKLTGVTVHVQLDKVMTQFLVELEPKYAEFVRDDGTCVVELDKALYGTIEAAKLWYDNISATLEADGYVKNPYDACVFNKENADGVQITVVLYVDDMLVSCEDSVELDKFASYLRKCYGDKEITEHRGSVVDFLGMTFDFTSKGKVRVTMQRLVDETIAGCGVTMERKTPAAEHLFEVNESAKKLGVEQKDYYRSYTAKLLYIGKRVKPEMMTAISFLTTRANSPDTDDLAKLHRALGYLLYTRDRGIVLEIGDTITVNAFVDAAYGVHTSTGKSHSGCAMVLGIGGPVHIKSTKQKLVTKSSTEAELVALSDYASQAIWMRNFIVHQGYDVGPVILHQDNMSCMALVKRGGPASERSRHIDIRHYWVKQLVDGKEAVVKHLSTDKMYVNVMTKPLQGQQFIRERNALTNWV